MRNDADADTLTGQTGSGGSECFIVSADGTLKTRTGDEAKTVI